VYACKFLDKTQLSYEHEMQKVQHRLVGIPLLVLTSGTGLWEAYPFQWTTNMNARCKTHIAGWSVFCFSSFEARNTKPTSQAVQYPASFRHRFKHGPVGDTCSLKDHWFKHKTQNPRHRLVGILLLLVIASNTSLWAIQAAIVPLYILRTSIMNAQCEWTCCLVP